MKLGLISDTHGHVDGVREASKIFQSREIETILHAGDVTKALHLQPLVDNFQQIHLVRGNCDYRLNPGELGAYSGRLTVHGTQGIVENGETRIGLTHGHLDSSIRELRAKDVEIIVHGHTHQQRDEVESEIRYLNPGAVKPPGSSVAIYDTEENTVRFVSLD